MDVPQTFDAESRLLAAMTRVEKVETRRAKATESFQCHRSESLVYVRLGAAGEQADSGKHGGL